MPINVLFIGGKICHESILFLSWCKGIDIKNTCMRKYVIWKRKINADKWQIASDDALIVLLVALL